MRLATYYRHRFWVVQYGDLIERCPHQHIRVHELDMVSLLALAIAGPETYPRWNFRTEGSGGEVALRMTTHLSYMNLN